MQMEVDIICNGKVVNKMVQRRVDGNRMIV